MASTLSNATLTVTLTENLVLNGSDHGSKKVISIAGVNEISKRIMTVATTPGTQVYAGASAAAAGTFVTDNVKYLRITNLDDTNFVVLHLSNGSDHYTQFSLAAGQVFILTDMSASLDNASAVASFSGENITEIYAMADTADVDIEIIVASS